MDGQQQNRFERAEQANVRGRREEAFRAMVEEIAAILVLHDRLYEQNNGVPQRHDVQGDTFMDQGGTIEFMVAIHAQLLMLIFDYVIVDLSRMEIKM